MALSGSFSGSVFNDHHKVRVDWTATQNVANNTTTITAKMYYVHDWSISISARSSAHSITIDGTTTTFSSSAISASSGEHLIGTATKTVSHNSEGKRSISMYASFALRATLNGTYYGNITASATITLDTIARASQPTASASSVAMGSAVTLYTNRASSSFTHTLTYTFGSSTGTIATGVGASVSWTVPLSLASQIPSATTGIVTITCYTYNGSTLVGTNTMTFTLTVPSSLVPSISAIACSDYMGYSSTFGGYVQGKSRVKVAVTASGSYSSTIKGYKIVANGATYTANNCVTEVLKSSGTNTISVTVTDSRGRTATKTTTIKVLEYKIPTIDTFKAVRCLNNGAEDADGAYMRISLAASVSPLTETLVECKNVSVFTLKYKKSTDSTYTTYSTWKSVSSIGQSVLIAADVNYSYDLQLTVTDSFSTAVANTTVGTAFTLLDFNASGGGVAIGKVSEQDAFECDLPAIFKSCKTTAGADLDKINSNLNVYKSEMNDLHHLGTFYAKTTAQTFNINNISGYKTLVFIGMDDTGTLQLDSVFVPTRCFKMENIGVSINCYAWQNYRGIIAVRYVSDTSIVCLATEIMGWSEVGFRVYGMI